MLRATYDVDRIDNRDHSFVDRCVRRLSPALDAWFRPVVRGLEHVPEGPALLVANHNGGMVSADTFVLGAALHRARGPERLPYALAHDLAVRAPGVHQVIVPLGAVRASPRNARRLFDAGHTVLVYPGGDLDSMRPFRERDRVVFGLRRGYVRTALEAGVPIVPVVSAGAHATSIVLDDGRWLARALHLPERLRLEVCPITLSVPWGLVVGITPPYVPLPTRIFLEVLAPIRFDRVGPHAARDARYVEACHERVLGRMQSALTRLAAERRRARWQLAARHGAVWVRTPAPVRTDADRARDREA